MMKCAHENLSLELIELIKSNFNKQIDQNDLTMQIVGGGIGLDSVQLVDLICLIEEKWGVEFSTDDLSFQHFSSFRELILLLERKLSGSII